MIQAGDPSCSSYHKDAHLRVLPVPHVIPIEERWVLLQIVLHGVDIEAEQGILVVHLGISDGATTEQNR